MPKDFDGTIVCAGNEHTPVIMCHAAAFTLLAHNAREFTNLAAILPEVYAEFHDSF